MADHNDTEQQRWIARLDGLLDALRAKDASRIKDYIVALGAAYYDHDETPGIIEASLDDLVACSRGPYHAAKALHEIGSRLEGRASLNKKNRDRYQSVLEKTAALLLPQLEALQGPHLLRVMLVSSRAAQKWTVHNPQLQEKMVRRMLDSTVPLIKRRKDNFYTAPPVEILAMSCALGPGFPLEKDISKTWHHLMGYLEAAVLGDTETSRSFWLCSLDGLLDLTRSAAESWDRYGCTTLAQQAADKWSVYLDLMAREKPVKALNIARRTEAFEIARRLSTKYKDGWSPIMENAAYRKVKEFEKYQQRKSLKPPGHSPSP